MTVNVSLNMYVIREARPVIDQSSSFSLKDFSLDQVLCWGFFELSYLCLINVVMQVEFCLDICLSVVYGELVMELFSKKYVFILLKFTTPTSQL